MSKIPLFKVAMSEQAKIDVGKVLDSGYIGQGPIVEKFESHFQTFLGSEVKPLTTSSCTAALILALKTLKIGVGDKVISTPMTCTATNLAIIEAGAQIIWADVDPYTGLIDPVSVSYLLGKYKVKAIVTVDWGGTLCDYNTLGKLSSMHGVPIIQDAAHCLHVPTNYSWDHFIAWSFGPIKHLTMTDGGALLTPDRYLEDAKLLRWFGIDRTKGDSFRCQASINLPGCKWHANDVQAQIGLSNFSTAVSNIALAKDNALYYHRELQGIPGLYLPPVKDSNQWWLYSIVAEDMRDPLINFLDSKGIAASPVHARNDWHPVFHTPDRNYLPALTTDLRGLNYFASNQLSIPVGWWVTSEQRKYIVKCIREFYRG